MEKTKELVKDAHAIVAGIPHVGRLTENIQEEMAISASAPPVSTTKGMHRRDEVDGCENRDQNEDVPEPHFKRQNQKKRRRRCSKCGKIAGHNASTCGKEPKPTKRPRGRLVGSGKTRNNNRGENDAQSNKTRAVSGARAGEKGRKGIVRYTNECLGSDEETDMQHCSDTGDDYFTSESEN